MRKYVCEEYEKEVVLQKRRGVVRDLWSGSPGSRVLFLDIFSETFGKSPQHSRHL